MLSVERIDERTAHSSFSWINATSDQSRARNGVDICPNPKSLAKDIHNYEERVILTLVSLIVDGLLETVSKSHLKCEGYSQVHNNPKRNRSILSNPLGEPIPSQSLREPRLRLDG